MTFGEVVVAAAIEAGKQETKSKAAAGRLLVAKCKDLGLNPPRNPANYVQYWKGRVTPKGKIQSRSHKSGRKPRLTTAQVESAYKAIINWEAAGRPRPFKSKKEIENSCGPVKKLLAKTGVQIGTLISRIKALHPRFGREKLRVRWALSEENKQERLAVAQELNNMKRSELQKVVHLDAKTVHMQEDEIYGYVDLAVGYTVAGIKPARKGGKVIKLKYYAAVNAKLGAFFIRFYTGTTDMPSTRDGLNYKVSSRCQTVGAGHQPPRVTKPASTGLPTVEHACGVWGRCHPPTPTTHSTPASQLLLHSPGP